VNKADYFLLALVLAVFLVCLDYIATMETHFFLWVALVVVAFGIILAWVGK